MENGKDSLIITKGLILGLLLIFILLIFIALFVKVHINRIKTKEQEKSLLMLEHQNKLLKNSVDIQEKERKRIAENLHDDVISQLYRIKLINTDISINKLIKESITTTRTISHLLSPPLLNQTSLGDLITDFIEPYRTKYLVELRVRSTNVIVSDLYKLNIFRILQEVITNCNKHAFANSLEVVCRISEERICLMIKDDGIGIPSEKKKGMGFKNIESRTQIIGGSHRFKPNKIKGTTFIFTAKHEK